MDLYIGFVKSHAFRNGATPPRQPGVKAAECETRGRRREDA